MNRRDFVAIVAAVALAPRVTGRAYEVGQRVRAIRREWDVYDSIGDPVGQHEYVRSAVVVIRETSPRQSLYLQFDNDRPHRPEFVDGVLVRLVS